MPAFDPTTFIWMHSKMAVFWVKKYPWQTLPREKNRFCSQMKNIWMRMTGVPAGKDVFIKKPALKVVCFHSHLTVFFQFFIKGFKFVAMLFQDRQRFTDVSL